MTDIRKVAIQDLARDAGDELAAQRRKIEALEEENDRLQTKVDDLREEVKSLQANNQELASSLEGLQWDYQSARNRLRIYGR